jgi:hypothetical protein
MKLYCRLCKQVLTRDMRFGYNKRNMTKRGLRSYCERKNKSTFLIPEVKHRR